MKPQTIAKVKAILYMIVFGIWQGYTPVSSYLFVGIVDNRNKVVKQFYKKRQ